MPSGFGWHFLFVLLRDSGKCLLEIVEDVIDMLQTNRQAHKTRRDAAGNQLLITELAVGCRCRMQDAAVNVCDMNLQRNHLQAVDKLGGARTAALDRERNDTGGAFRQIFLLFLYRRFL